MGEKRSVEEQFGPVAEDYARFSYHAAGPDLAPMLAAGELSGSERVLDIGSGPGHTALLFATRAHEVVASDPTAEMLDQGRRLAAERGLDNTERAPLRRCTRGRARGCAGSLANR
ncbi:MAG: methyltransferase domain-containing protein [Deltaproteobacteria bacterium]|nr:methyltransferase domain-containing protein [Deltaproteobacteria bacterium]